MQRLRLSKPKCWGNGDIVREEVKMAILLFVHGLESSFSIEMHEMQHAGVPPASHRRNGTPKVELTNSARALQRSMGHLEEKSSASCAWHQISQGFARKRASIKPISIRYCRIQILNKHMPTWSGCIQSHDVETLRQCGVREMASLRRANDCSYSCPCFIYVSFSQDLLNMIKREESWVP